MFNSNNHLIKKRDMKIIKEKKNKHIAGE
uniref:Uncharacterized protein n=1 Tax=Rhizophora mucronata TaxID=61149 RepID=A0A2P2NNH1_RHIMU